MNGLLNFQDMADESLFNLVKQRVPEIPVDRVNDSNRSAVIAVLKITEKIRKRKVAQNQSPKIGD